MLRRLLASVQFQRFLIKFALVVLPSVVRVGRTVFVLRWNDVADVLSRDDTFRIAPVNQKRIEGVSGPFFLGMDRCPDYFAQRSSGYRAMRAAAPNNTCEHIRQRAIALLDENPQKIDVVGQYARPIAAMTACDVFGVGPEDRQQLMQVSRAVFHETFLNLSDNVQIQKAGRGAGKTLGTWTQSEITKRRSNGQLGQDFLGTLLTDPTISDEQAEWITNGYMIGSIDTTATVVANVIYELVSKKSRLHQCTEDLDSNTRMMGWCMEALRMRPHNPLLVREAACDAAIAGRKARQGDRVMAITFAAHHDPSIFPNPGLLDPTRPARNYMHFGYGPHACAGRDLNMMQIPVLVSEILKRRPKTVSRIVNDGPFPDHLTVGF